MEDFEEYDDYLEDENIAPLEDYEKVISMEIKQNPDFDIFVEIETVQNIRDAHYVLHEYEQAEDQSKKLLLLRWKSFYMSMNCDN